MLFLRPAREDAEDSIVFYFPGSAQVAAIAGDSRRVAFLENSENSWHFSDRFGIVSLDSETPLFIDWPRLELDPAAMQTLKQ